MPDRLLSLRYNEAIAVPGGRDPGLCGQPGRNPVFHLEHRVVLGSSKISLVHFMRLTTKLTLGFSSLILIFLGAHLYQEQLIHEMQQAQEDLSRLSFDSGLQALALVEDLRDLREFTQKFLQTVGDTFYRDEARAIRESLDGRIDQLNQLNRDNEFLQPQMQELDRAWLDLRSDLMAIEGLEASTAQADRLRRWDEVEPKFETLLSVAQKTVRASDRMIEVGMERSRAMAARVNWVSRAALFVALGLSLAVTALLFRSIARSLGPLIIGTRRISRGDFAYKVDESGGDELAELASYFNRMARRLGELDQLKRDFVSWVSHDLRAPLASIQETTRLLLDQFSDDLESPQRRLLELNLASAQRLSQMIRNLLDLSSIEAGVVKYDFEKVNVAEILAGAAEDVHGLLFDRKLQLISLDEASDLEVWADPVRLRQVLGNLLSNAIKFSPEGGTIRINARPCDQVPSEAQFLGSSPPKPRHGGYCWISVSDEGPGVPTEIRNRIFDQYYRADHRTASSRQGTGLGLAIVRRVVEAHDGAIWIEDNPDRGSTFFVLLHRPAG